jgi:serine/threonine-protein kinase
METLGPVAPHLTRKASRQATTLAELCQELARFLPSSGDRQAFLTWTSTQLRVSPALGTSTTRTRAVAVPAIAWDPAVLQRAAKDLAVHLGPLARILVRRASGRAHDVRELYELLAPTIPNESARAAFLRAALPDATGR